MNLEEEIINRFCVSEICAKVDTTVQIEINTTQLIEEMKDNGYTDEEILELFGLIDEGEYEAKYIPPTDYEIYDHTYLKVKDFEIEW